MDHRERVIRAIQRQPVDRVPCAELCVEESLIKSLHRTKHIDFDHKVRFMKHMGQDAVCLHPVFQLADERCFPIYLDAVFEDLDQWVNTNYFIFAVISGPIGWGAKVYGYSKFLSKMVRRSSDVVTLTNIVEKLNLGIVQRVLDRGVHGIIFADDIAFNDRLIAHPTLLRELLLGSLVRQVNFTKSQGIPVFFHSDGNINLLLDEIVDIGFDGLHCIDALAGMDIGAIKKHYGRKLCLWGNLEADMLFERRPYFELANRVHSILDKAAYDSGYIFGTSSGLCEGMNLHNIQDTCQAVHRYGDQEQPHASYGGQSI